MKYPVALSVNGREYSCEVEARTLLVDLLRDQFGLTGTHIGCETSRCGACTVFLDGTTVKSCTRLAVQADGSEVTTIEGLAGEAQRQGISTDGGLHPIQQGFWECHGLQCGFCTPGMVLAAKQLLDRVPDPTEAEIRRAIEGNLCRCTGYQHIVQAVTWAAKRMNGGGEYEEQP